MSKRQDARAGRKAAMLSLGIGVFFTLLAGFMIAGAAFGFGAGILPGSLIYFFAPFLIAFLVVGILGLIVAYRKW